jgi:hypothetical protein
LLDAHIVRLGKSVETQIILVQVHLCEQGALQLFILHLVEPALEDGLLNPLADSFADLRDAAQSASTLRRFGRDIIGRDDEHGLESLIHLARYGR